MRELALQSTVGNQNSLSARLGRYLRDRVSAKQLARMIDCDVRTAENLRRGTWPIERHYQRLKDAFGKPFVVAIHWPDEAAAEVEEHCRELERQLQEKRALQRALQAGAGALAAPSASRPAAGG